MKASKVIPVLLISVCLVVGLVLLAVGIRERVLYHRQTAGYQSTDGYFYDYSIYSSDRDGTTYRLTYRYTVGGESYTVSTDYGSGTLPTYGSTRTVLYSPDNPAEAVLAGVNRQMLLLVLGGMFTLVPLVFILGWLSAAGRLARFSVDPLGLFIGFVFVVLGVSFYYLMAGSFSIVAAFSAAGLWVAVPILMAAVGSLQVIRCLVQCFRRPPASNAPPDSGRLH